VPVRGRPVILVLAAALVAGAAGYGIDVAVQPSTPGGADSMGGAARPVHALDWRGHRLATSGFDAVACAGRVRCMAFGPGGTLATSKDGGTSWSVARPTVLEGLTVLAATCVNERHCIAVAEPDVTAFPPTGGTPGLGVALVSDSAGRSWRHGSVSVPNIRFLGGLACPSASVCYATAAGRSSRLGGGFLLVSTDGGASWTRRRAGPRDGLGGPLACPEVGRCVAALPFDGVAVTSDGGQRWRMGREPLGGGGFPGVSALACSSVSTCVGVGSEPHPGFPVIIATTDGGSSWRFANFAIGRVGTTTPAVEIANGSYDGVSCSGLRCAAVASTLPEVGLLAESADGGRNWRTAALGEGSFSAVTCTTVADCVAAGTTANASAVLAQLRAGRWQVRYAGPGTEWSALSCPTTRHCVAVDAVNYEPSAAAEAITNDGGLRWSAEQLPPGVLGMVAIACPSGRRCVAVADVAASAKEAEGENDGVAALFSSDDGGESWRRDDLSVAPGTTLDALSCPTVSSCYAVGATPYRLGGVPDDAVVSTADGGARWTAGDIPAFPPQPPTGTSGSEILGGGLTSISCFGPRSCIVGGPAGVLATTDGTHWSLRYQAPGAGNGGVVSGGILFGTLELLSCGAPSSCAATFSTPDSGDQLRLSTNGGRSWRTAAAPSGSTLSALICPTATECLAVGSGPRGALVLESLDGARHFSRAGVPPLAGAPVSDVVASYPMAPRYTAVACAEPSTCLALGTATNEEVVVAH
jgi:photosystem II stability/assembly factor-like uncharacterized protein